MTSSIPGASVWEQQLYDHMTGHIEGELEVLQEYRALADDPTAAPAARFIAGLIIEDERRHHQWFLDIAEALRQMGELRDSDEPIPSLHGMRDGAARLVTLSDRLIDVEREDARELKALAGKLKDVRDTTLFGLLVDIMRHDTDKHLMILKFLRARAKEAAKP